VALEQPAVVTSTLPRYGAADSANAPPVKSSRTVVDGYLLALASTILPGGGSISDLFGRLPVMRFGLATFGMGSVLAATADSPAMLVTGRVIQGLGGAFLVPGSLALINSAFDRTDRAAAIGSWTAWTGTAFAVGPLLGGLGGTSWVGGGFISSRRFPWSSASR
jgi:MFS family permease